jgi:LysR family glycine cleavage system transcriptional activator
MDKRLKQLSNLRSFESAARHESYSKAAKELFVTQAAVSQQMRQLEAIMGSKLFARNGRKMELTLSGEKLFTATQKAFSTLLKGFNSIQTEAVAGTLTITSTQAFTSLWLMPRLYKFSIKHPEIKIKVVASNNIEDLRQGHIDLAIRFITTGEVDRQDDMAYEFIAEDHVYPACSPQLVTEYDFKEPKDILNCWLVSLENQGAIDWLTWFKQAGVDNYQCHKKWTEVSSGDMALSAVLSGHGFTLASQALFSQYVNTGQLVIPFNIKHPVSFKRYFVFDPNSAKRSRLDVFITWLKEETELDEKNTSAAISHTHFNLAL